MTRGNEAVPVPGMDRAAVVRLLRERFPALAQLFGDPDNLDPETPEPYFSYERFAEEVLRRQNDRNLVEATYAFINELALSRDYWLEEVFGVALLEHLAQDAAFAAAAYPHLNNDAQNALRAIEEQMYGRLRD